MKIELIILVVLTVLVNSSIARKSRGNGDGRVVI